MLITESKYSQAFSKHFGEDPMTEEINKYKLENDKVVTILDELASKQTEVEELNEIKHERQEKTARKEIWANRKRLPKRDPVTPEIYQALIDATGSISLAITAIQQHAAIIICISMDN